MQLHVTNGTVLAERLSALRYPGIILPWREILHEGPLPPYEAATEVGRRSFNATRAAFIVQQGWGTLQDVVFDMDQRDRLVLDTSWTEVVLWFERDLYDQLSLAQILSLLSGSGSFREGSVTHVFSDRHLTKLSNEEVNVRYERRTLIDADLCQHYVQFFSDLGAGVTPMPQKSAPVALTDAAATWQTLQPDASGMSDFDRLLIDLVKRRGPLAVGALFEALQRETGDDAFMSDLAFHARLTSLVDRSEAIEINGDVIQLQGI